MSPKRYQCMLRDALHYRKASFAEGLAAAGFTRCQHISDPTPEDVLVIWNRYGQFSNEADRFERKGAAVLVAENGYLGKGWRGGEWFALSLNHHSGAGRWAVGGPERWDTLGESFSPFQQGEETLVLAQRGIGHPKVRSPDGWAELVCAHLGGRIRQHPGGRHPPSVSLREDLHNVREVITWNSAAALSALMMGVPVWHAHPDFLGAPASRPLMERGSGVEPLRDEEARLQAFRRLIWAMWTLDEIRSGVPIHRLFALHAEGTSSPK